jgi:hypothetical protein
MKWIVATLKEAESSSITFSDFKKALSSLWGCWYKELTLEERYWTARANILKKDVLPFLELVIKQQSQKN